MTEMQNNQLSIYLEDKVEKYMITHCNLQDDMLKDLFNDINIHTIRSLNLFNNLITDEKVFF